MAAIRDLLLDGNVAMVTCALVDGHARNHDVAVEYGFLFEMKLAATDEIAGDVPINDGLLTMHFIGKCNVGLFLNDESLAMQLSHDFAGAVECHIPRAINTPLESALDEDVVTMNGDIGNHSLFLDGNVAPGLDPSVPVAVNHVVLEADVCPAGGTECRGGFRGCLMLVIALETLDLPARVFLVKEATRRAHSLADLGTELAGARVFLLGIKLISPPGGMFSICCWISTLLLNLMMLVFAVFFSGGKGVPGSVVYLQRLAMEHLIVAATAATVGGYGDSRLGLLVLAIGTRHRDQIPLWGRLLRG